MRNRPLCKFCSKFDHARYTHLNQNWAFEAIINWFYSMLIPFEKSRRCICWNLNYERYHLLLNLSIKSDLEVSLWSLVRFITVKKPICYTCKRSRNCAHWNFYDLYINFTVETDKNAIDKKSPKSIISSQVQ